MRLSNSQAVMVKSNSCTQQTLMSFVLFSCTSFPHSPLAYTGYPRMVFTKSDERMKDERMQVSKNKSEAQNLTAVKDNSG